jgi:hypothetical protein
MGNKYNLRRDIEHIVPYLILLAIYAVIMLILFSL